MVEIKHNCCRYIYKIAGGIEGSPKRPERFMLGMVAIRSDGWVALIDILAMPQFKLEFLDTPGLEWSAVTMLE
jgi:hypothetical protein